MMQLNRRVVVFLGLLVVACGQTPPAKSQEVNGGFNDNSLGSSWGLSTTVNTDQGGAKTAEIHVTPMAPTSHEITGVRCTFYDADNNHIGTSPLVEPSQGIFDDTYSAEVSVPEGTAYVTTSANCENPSTGESVAMRQPSEGPPLD